MASPLIKWLRLFLYSVRRSSVLDEEKIFLTWNEQVERLKKRHIVFNNVEEEKNAKYAIQNNSYYSFVNGYKDIFCIKGENGEDDFQGEYFINLRDAYDFDKELSALVFKYLLRVEDSIKAIFSYYVGKAYGHKQNNYLSPSNYRSGNYVKNKNKYQKEILLDMLNNTILNSNEPQLIHYRKEYGYTPPWVLASCVSLATLLHWFKLSNTEIKKSTINTMIYDCTQYPFKHFTVYEENAELFTNLTTIIKEYRNRAAHGSRIMNHVSRNNIKINWLELYVANRRDVMRVYQQGSLNRDLFSLLIAITVMLSKRNTVRKKFIDETEKLFLGLKDNNEYLYSKIMKETKMPLNFSSILKNIV